MAVFCPKMASEAISVHLISTNFLGEDAPRTLVKVMIEYFANEIVQSIVENKVTKMG